MDMTARWRTAMLTLQGLRIVAMIRQAEFEIERFRRMQEWADDAYDRSRLRLAEAQALGRPIARRLA